jgi:UDP-glucose 4-epimerase
MHIVVVGGNGFIGSHFVKDAAQRGHKITVVGRNQKPAFQHGEPYAFVPGGIDALAQDPSLIEASDVICHMASTTIPATATANPVEDIQQNLEPLVALLEAMRRTGKRRLLYISSGGAVYGHPKTTPITECHPTDPISAYGVQKLAAEKYLQLYEHLYGFRVTILRPANPYGPGQQGAGRIGVVNTFVDLARSGNIATIWGDGSTVRDFVHVTDLSRCLTAALENDVVGTFNCGGGQGVSIRQLIEIVERQFGRELAKAYLPARLFDPPEVILDISKAERELGWRPSITLDEGIRSLAG